MAKTTYVYAEIKGGSYEPGQVIDVSEMEVIEVDETQPSER